MPIACADPESFFKGAPTLSTFFLLVDEGKGDPNTNVSGPSSARQQNAVKIVVLGSSLPSSTKKTSKFDPPDKTFWIRACSGRNLQLNYFSSKYLHNAKICTETPTEQTLIRCILWHLAWVYTFA